MKVILAILFAIFSSLTFAHYYQQDRGDGGRADGGSVYHGVPGPIAGAGLPVLVVGYGVYWLARRRRSKTK